MRSSSRPSWLRRRAVAGAVVATLAVFGLVGAVPAGAQQPVDPTPPPGEDIPDAAAEQIAAIAEDKADRTPVEQKVDSNLLYAAADEADGTAVEGAPALESTADVDRQGRTEVDIAAEVDAELLDRLEDLGGEVLESVPGFDAIRAVVPVEALIDLAADDAVRSIAPAGEAQTNGLPAAAPDAGTASVGNGASEADVTHGADVVRATYGLDGTGVKACVLSDGVSSLAARQATGDLPAVDVLPGQAGSGDEGTAMLELIHDMAPGAELGFATAFGSQAGFAQNIIDLRSDGCDVIVDDITYFAEAAFQDDDVARAVSQVKADGAIYFTSAGNSGNLADGTAGAWQGDFQDAGASAAPLPAGLRVHGWGTGVTSNALTAGSNQFVSLHWADPLLGSDNDYDLYVLDSAGTSVVSAGTNDQTGTQDPFEFADAYAGERLVVARAAGAADRYLAVYTNRGRLTVATAGATYGHNASVDAISTAATPAATAFDGPSSAGPFPGQHSGSDLSERFSSDGPSRSYYAPDGTPLTPGDLSSTGGQVRNGVDITAADGVITTTPGFLRFYGTSAAAPNAAAMAVLALSGDPTLTPDELEDAMQASAIDVEQPGEDVTTGPGIAMAPALMSEIGLDDGSLLVPTGRSIVEVAGDGDTSYEPGEIFDVVQPLRNDGAAAATSVTAALTSTSPDVAITPASTTYGTIAPGATADPVAAFRIRISRSCACAARLPFTFTAAYGGGFRPSRTDAFTLVVGDAVGPATTAAYAGPAIPIPDDDPSGVTATVDVGDVGTIGEVSLTIGGSACTATAGATTVGIDHSYVGDLTLTLTSPAGTSVDLTAPSGNNGNNLCQTVFTDAAATPFSSAVSAAAPFTGSYRPLEPLGVFSGEDPEGTWTLRATDAEAQDTGSIRAFSIDVAPALCDILANTAPTAVADAYDTPFGMPLEVTAPGVLENDTDAELDPLSAALVDDVDDGTLTLDADGSVSYTPDEGFSGDDTFTYTARDGELSSPATTVTITVGPDPNTAPTAVADDHDTPHETPLAVAAPGVLGNDTDAEDDTLTATLVEDVEDGVLSLSPDGSFTYTPDDGFSGDDTFTYVASDGRLASATTTVTITVGEKPNGAPVAVADAYSTAYETLYAAAAPGVLGNDTDDDGDALTAAPVDDVDHGTLALQADGSFTYTPDAGFSGDDTFTYTAADGELSSPAATVTITVGPEPNAAPAAQPDEYDVDFETTLADAAPGVLGNDADDDGDALTAALGDDVDHGTLALQADGSFTYTPDAGFTGEDTFTYRASDGDLASGAATVTLTVTRSTDAFVDALYRDFLGRPAEASGLAFWGDRLLDGLDSRATVARKVARSGEYARLVVGRAYLAYLGRPAEPGGLTYWSERVRTGLSVSELPIRLMGSPELLVRAGGTQVGFVEAVFLAVLGRAPTATERWLQVASLQRGTSRTTLARAVHGGLESRHRRTVAQYDLLLDRIPTTSERDLWAGRLTRLDDRDLAVALAATDEYLAAAGAP